MLGPQPCPKGAVQHEFPDFPNLILRCYECVLQTARGHGKWLWAPEAVPGMGARDLGWAHRLARGRRAASPPPQHRSWTGPLQSPAAWAAGSRHMALMSWLGDETTSETMPQELRCPGFEKNCLTRPPVLIVQSATEKAEQRSKKSALSPVPINSSPSAPTLAKQTDVR